MRCYLCLTRIFFWQGYVPKDRGKRIGAHYTCSLTEAYLREESEMHKFKMLTKHPKDGHWETAWWGDEYFGRHRGVYFPSTNETFRADAYKWETV